MRIHAILTGRVQIKEAQIEGHGHGLWRQIQPIVSSEWAEWVPVYAALAPLFPACGAL